MKKYLIAFSALSLAMTFPTIVNAGIVNVDFNGQRQGDLSSAGTYIGSGAAGGGNVFNGVSVFSGPTGGPNNDSLTVTASHLLNDSGLATNVGLTVTPVGGDANPDITVSNPPPAPTSSSALFGDYFFNPGAATITISGLVPNSTVDVYTYTTFLSNYSFATGAPANFTPTSPFTDFLPSGGGNTLLWAGITVSPSGTITGSLPGTDVIEGLTIVGNIVPVPEPSSVMSLLALGGVGVILFRRRRAANGRRA